MFNVSDHQGNTVKSTIKYHITPLRWGLYIKKENNKYWAVC